MATNPQQFIDFIDKVVKFYLLRQSFINGMGQEFREEYCVMAEVAGMRCYSDPTDTLEELKRGITMEGGFTNFIFKHAMTYLDEEDIQQLKLAREEHPGLAERTHLKIIHDRIDEVMAMEIENYPDHETSREMVAARICWEVEEEPEYRRENV